MCEYCDEPYKNMSVGEGEIKIARNRYSPSGYSLIADNGGGEYAKADFPVRFCPKCGRDLMEE